MFWRWNEEYAYMDRGEGEHLSQWEKASQRLLGATFWGDYAGDIYTRALYTVLLEDHPELVESISPADGHGLILKHTDQSYRPILEVLAQSFAERADDLSEVILDIQDKEMGEGWTGRYFLEEIRAGLKDLTDWTGIDSLIPEQGSDEFWSLYREIRDENEGEYWDSATVLVVPFDREKGVDYLLERYAATFDPTQEEELL